MACGCRKGGDRRTGEDSKYNYRHLKTVGIIQPYELEKLYWQFDRNPEKFKWKEWNDYKVEWYNLIYDYLSFGTWDDISETFLMLTKEHNRLVECRKDVCQQRKDKYKRWIVDCWITTYPDIGPPTLKKRIAIKGKQAECQNKQTRNGTL